MRAVQAGGRDDDGHARGHFGSSHCTVAKTHVQFRSALALQAMLVWIGVRASLDETECWLEHDQSETSCDRRRHVSTSEEACMENHEKSARLRHAYERATDATFKKM